MRIQIKNIINKTNAIVKSIIVPLKNPKVRLVRTYNKYCETKPIKENVILFQAYQATRMSCNPMAIFLAMRKDPYYKDFVYVWALEDEDNAYAKQYKEDKSVIFCKMESKEYIKYLSTAKYLVNNKTFSYYFKKRTQQVHISTWHGIPLKTLGKQQFGSMGQYCNVARNYIHTDYLIMPDKFTADILLDCCDLTTCFDGYVVDAGYPRTDFTVNTDYQEMREFLKEQLDIDITKKIVLYAPTWRGEVGSSQDTTAIILKNLTDLSEGLPEGYLLLLKIHDRTYTFVKNNEKLSKMKNVPDWMETNQLLAAVDILITDYSSLYFDFLSLRRPVIFFVYDRTEYESTRGLYFNMDTEVPGPLCYTAEQVNETIQNIVQVHAKYQAISEKLIQEYCYNDDGSCTKRVLNIIFKGEDMEYTYKVNTQKTRKIAVNAGDFPSNPYAIPIIHQLNQLELGTDEIYVVYNRIPTQADERYLKKLNPRIKVMYRVPLPERKLRSYYLGKPYYEKGFAKRFVGNAAAQRYREHYFGALKFDVVIDMWGKPSFWQLIFAKTQFEKKVAYLPKLVTPQMLVYLKKQFDQLVCVDAKLYPKYKKMLQNIEGKAELLLIPLPVDLSNFVRDLQEDMSYLMSYAKTAAVNLEQHKEEFYFNEHINQYQEMMRAPVLKASDELSQAMEARMAAYQKEYQESQQQFAALFSVAK